MSVNLELDNSCPLQKYIFIHVLNKPGRPLRIVSYFEISTVLSVFTKYPCNALTLESILLNRHDIKIPHNRIHKILKDFKLKLQMIPTNKGEKVDQI